tara:strand:+ start:739 stop:1404 length:666 start_codon:yes stop_codon:yes gene_type:complete
MANLLNSGSLNTLKLDETLLSHVQKAANDSYQACFVERIDRNGTPPTDSDNDEIDALSTLNYGDSRFQRGSVTYVYTRITPESIALMNIKNADGSNFDLDAAEFSAKTTKAGKVVQACDLNILNPTIQESTHPAMGMRYRVKLVETHEPTQWQLDNSAHKINPSTKEELTVTDPATGEVKKIYSGHKMVFATANPKHMLIAHDRVAVTSESNVVQEEMSMI